MQIDRSADLNSHHVQRPRSGGDAQRSGRTNNELRGSEGDERVGSSERTEHGRSLRSSRRAESEHHGHHGHRVGSGLRRFGHAVQRQVGAFLRENQQLDAESRSALVGAVDEFRGALHDIRHARREGAFESREAFAEAVSTAFESFVTEVERIASPAADEATVVATEGASVPAVPDSQESVAPPVGGAERIALAEPVAPAVADLTSSEATAASLAALDSPDATPLEGLLAMLREQGDRLEGFLDHLMGGGQHPAAEIAPAPIGSVDLRIGVTVSLYARFTIAAPESLGTSVDATA